MPHPFTHTQARGKGRGERREERGERREERGERIRRLIIYAENRNKEIQVNKKSSKDHTVSSKHGYLWRQITGVCLSPLTSLLLSPPLPSPLSPLSLTKYIGGVHWEAPDMTTQMRLQAKVTLPLRLPLPSPPSSPSPPLPLSLSPLPLPLPPSPSLLSFFVM